jgi:DNA-binding XRE family transcriptional regulator
VNTNFGFGATLRELRQSYGLTQAQFAEPVGVSHVCASALEIEAKPSPRFITVLSLAHSPGVPEDDLWAMAQAEREERLRLRIQGAPTSLRKQRSKSDANPPDPDTDDALLLKKLKAITPNEHGRERAIQTLDILLELLGNR